MSENVLLYWEMHFVGLRTIVEDQFRIGKFRILTLITINKVTKFHQSIAVIWKCNNITAF